MEIDIDLLRFILKICVGGFCVFGVGITLWLGGAFKKTGITSKSKYKSKAVAPDYYKKQKKDKVTSEVVSAFIKDKYYK